MSIFWVSSRNIEKNLLDLNKNLIKTQMDLPPGTTYYHLEGGCVCVMPIVKHAPVGVGVGVG